MCIRDRFIHSCFRTTNSITVERSSLRVFTNELTDRLPVTVSAKSVYFSEDGVDRFIVLLHGTSLNANMVAKAALFKPLRHMFHELNIGRFSLVGESGTNPPPWGIPPPAGFNSRFRIRPKTVALCRNGRLRKLRAVPPLHLLRSVRVLLVETLFS